MSTGISGGALASNHQQLAGAAHPMRKFKLLRADSRWRAPDTGVREVSRRGKSIRRKAETWFAAVREERAAPSAPRSGPPAATLFGGLRPRSLRVHDPCKEVGHGSRLGFPGRRPPRDPAAPGNVARDLQVLPRQAEFARGGGYLPEGEGRWAWTWGRPTPRALPD